MHHSSVSIKITLLYFFSWKLIWFGQKKATKMQNFRLSTANLKFHQIHTLIGSVFWMYIKFQLKKYRGFILHGTEEWCKIQFVVSKMTRFGEFSPDHFKFSKFSLWVVAFCARYITFELKMYRGVTFNDTEEWCSIWRKNHLWFGIWHEGFDKFLPKHSKLPKLGLLWNTFIQSRKCMNLKFTQELCVRQWRMMQNLKRNWHVVSKLTWGIWRISTWQFDLNGLLLSKVYNVWGRKVWKYCLMVLKIYAKFEEKLTCAFQNDVRNLENFHTLKRRLILEIKMAEIN